MANALDEYVIKLGAQIDNQGIQKLFSLLDSSKMKALGITAAISAATTAVYKFVESATKQELELEKLAKKQQKTIENVRATETALKAMGKTLKEVQQDKALTSIYNDLVKFNKSLAFPDMKGAINMVNNLRGAFWKLKSSVQYAVQWINARVLSNLAEPIERITNKLTQAANWVRDNMTSITAKISSFVTGFAKGIIGIVEGFEKLAGYVNDLPDGVKRIGSAIAVVFGLLKSGPVGQILTAITMIGGLIDDYENFKWNQMNPDQDPVGVAFQGLWELIESGDFEGAIGKLFEAITEGLRNFSEQLDNFDFAGFLQDPEGKLGGFVDSIVAYFGPEGAGQGKLEELGGAIWGFIESALAFTGNAATNIAGSIVQIFTSPELDAEIDKKLKVNSITGGIGTGIVMKMLGAGDFVSIAAGFVSAWKIARETAKREFLDNHQTATDSEINEKAMEILGIDVANLGSVLVELITSAISAVDDLGSKVYGAIAKALGDDTEAAKIFSTLAGPNEEGSTIGDALVNGIIAGFTTGNFLVGLAGFFSTVAKDIADGKGTQIGEELEALGQSIATLLFGTFNEATGEQEGGIFNVIGKFFSGLWEGENGNGLKKVFDDLKTNLQEAFGEGGAFENIFDPIVNALVSAFDKAWGMIKASLPDWLVDLFGLDKNSKTTFTQNPDGSITMQRDTGESVVGPEEAAAMAKDLELKLSRERKSLSLFGIEGITHKGGVVPKGFEEELQNYKQYGTEPGDEIDAQMNADVYTQAMTNAYERGDTAGLSYLESLYTQGMSKTKGFFGQDKFTNWLADLARLSREYEENGAPLNYVPKEQDNTKYDAEAEAFVKSFEKYFAKDETGSWEPIEGKGFNLLSETGVPNLATWGELFTYVMNSGKMPTDENGNVFSAKSIVDNYNAQASDFNVKIDLFNSGAEKLGTTAKNTSSLVEYLASSVTSATSAVDSFVEKLASFNPTGGPHEAMGGRIGEETNGVTVGEDGPEYIIPITKPNRAFSLINQMLHEMGENAVGRVMEGFGLGTKGTLGEGGAGGAGGLLSGGSGMNLYTVSAPVNITVNANGADGATIGKTAYDMAESHLLEALRGVFAS